MEQDGRHNRPSTAYMKKPPLRGGFFISSLYSAATGVLSRKRKERKYAMTGRRVTRAVTILMAAVLLAASCSAKTDAADLNKPNPRLPTVTLRSGDIRVIAEVADIEIERNRGLMFRKSLDEGKGMLFVFEQDQRVSFWMRNTSIPLSLAYITADGTIVQILDLKPYSEQPRPSERSVRYALEVPQGWYGKVGLGVGDKFEIPIGK